MSRIQQQSIGWYLPHFLHITLFSIQHSLGKWQASHVLYTDYCIQLIDNLIAQKINCIRKAIKIGKISNIFQIFLARVVQVL